MPLTRGVEGPWGIEVDHLALCGEALQGAVEALGREDVERAIDCLNKVEFEARWARVALRTAIDEAKEAELTRTPRDDSS